MMVTYAEFPKGTVCRRGLMPCFLVSANVISRHCFLYVMTGLPLVENSPVAIPKLSLCDRA